LVGWIVGRPDCDLLELACQLQTEGFDKGAAEIAGEAGVIVGEDADVQEFILPEDHVGEKPVAL
jgi:hypothetical protein